MLEMRKMKDSGIEWIGEVPERWETQKLKYYATVTSGEILSKDEYVFSGDIPVIGSNGKIGTTYKSNNHSEVITTGRVGTIGTAQIVQDAWITDNALIIKSHSISRPFLTYVIPNFDFKFMLSGTAQPLITATKLKNQYIPVPSSEVQDKLVQYLNTQIFNLSHLISQVCSSIELYKKFKQAVITQAVTKGVRGEREMKDSGVDYIGQIPAEWVLGKLRNVGDTQNGISKSSEFFGKGFPFVSYSDVYKNYSLPSTVSGLVDSTSEEQKRYSVKKGDIFFTRTSETIEEVGFSCVCEKDIPNATFAGFLIRVRPFSDKLYTTYAKYYFRSSHLRFYLVKEMNLVTRASLGQSLLKSMPVLLPPLEEQKEIADYLDTKCAEIDGLIAKKDQLAKELESYKKSLIYEVVTGKREV